MPAIDFLSRFSIIGSQLLTMIFFSEWFIYMYDDVLQFCKMFAIQPGS